MVFHKHFARVWSNGSCYSCKKNVNVLKNTRVCSLFFFSCMPHPCLIPFSILNSLSSQSMLKFQEKNRLPAVYACAWITPFAVHLEKICNHLHLTSDKNAKIGSFAPIGIQLCKMHPPQGYLHNCKHSIKFEDFHWHLVKFKLVKATFICAYCKFNNIKRIFFGVFGHSF